jgi:hypothetical protein
MLILSVDKKPKDKLWEASVTESVLRQIINTFTLR